MHCENDFTPHRNFPIAVHTEVGTRLALTPTLRGENFRLRQSQDVGTRLACTPNGSGAKIRGWQTVDRRWQRIRKKHSSRMITKK